MAISHATDDVVNLTKPLPANQSIVIDHTNLTARKYIGAVASKSQEQRRYAEGRAWCDYQKYKTITIEETLFAEPKKLPNRALDAGGGEMIAELLSKKFPCE